jgi:hypothetical protein
MGRGPISAEHLTEWDRQFAPTPHRMVRNTGKIVPGVSPRLLRPRQTP